MTPPSPPPAPATDEETRPCGAAASSFPALPASAVALECEAPPLVACDDEPLAVPGDRVGSVTEEERGLRGVGEREKYDQMSERERTSTLLDMEGGGAG